MFTQRNWLDQDQVLITVCVTGTCPCVGFCVPGKAGLFGSKEVITSPRALNNSLLLAFTKHNPLIITALMTRGLLTEPSRTLSDLIQNQCLPGLWACARPPGCCGVCGGRGSSVRAGAAPRCSASALAASGKPSLRSPRSPPGPPGPCPAGRVHIFILRSAHRCCPTRLPEAEPPFQTHQQLFLGLRSQRADGQLQSAHRQGVCSDRNAEAFIETHLGLRLQRRAAVKRTGPAGIQWNQVHLHIPGDRDSD